MLRVQPWRQKQIDPFRRTTHAAVCLSVAAGREGKAPPPPEGGMHKKGTRLLPGGGREKRPFLGPRCHGKGCGRGQRPDCCSARPVAPRRPLPCLQAVYRPPALLGWQDCACVFPLPWPLRNRIIIKRNYSCFLFSVFVILDARCRTPMPPRIASKTKKTPKADCVVPRTVQNKSQTAGGSAPRGLGAAHRCLQVV